MSVARASLPGRAVARGRAARWIAPWLLAACAIAAPQAAAQGFESALSPGELSAPHAKLDGDCDKCHVRFDRSAQDGRCMDCHKDVAQDLRSRAGLHGRQPAQACRTCHTEHKGRGARIAALDRSTFDHAKTSFALRDAHLKTACTACHAPAKGYRLPARDCSTCHAKQDVHKGSLGARCNDCHTEASWRQARFDHAKTRFALTGRHEAAACTACHKDAHYRDTPQACHACHKADDRHKGRFGEQCETCHATSDWKSTRFRHDADTRYPLVGRHRLVRCEACHAAGNAYVQKAPTACADCHRGADPHKGSLGTDCARCHTERAWKEPVRFDHAKTAFPLAGRHVAVACKSCHLGATFKEAATTCAACHARNDVHQGALGDRCGDCHSDRGWKGASFDHATTRFPLVGRHAQAACKTCHLSAAYREVQRECSGCHQRDDTHAGQLGRACADCHDERAWKPAPKFDHALAPFPLLGLHARVACRECHASARFKDAGTDCYACHAKADKHAKTLGTACAQCHNPRTWKAWDFDHDRRTRFALEGRHRAIACQACHAKPAEAHVEAPTQCYACHARQDVHEGSYGRQCQQCHLESSFRTIRSRSTTSGVAVPDAVAPRTAVSTWRPAS